MKVEIFQGDVEELRPIIESWRTTCDNRFGFDLDVEGFENDLILMMESDHADLLVLKSKGDRLLGFMGLLSIKCSLEDSFSATEHYWYILPEHRGQGIKMIGAAQAWARDKGCKRLMMNASRLAGRGHDKVCRLYERLGFDHFETVYIKELSAEL